MPAEVLLQLGDKGIVDYLGQVRVKEFDNALREMIVDPVRVAPFQRAQNTPRVLCRRL